MTTEITTRVKRATPPSGPAIPLGSSSGAGGATAQVEDTPRVVRQSALVIGFLAAGAPPSLLTEGVHAALTAPDGCGLPASADREAFALAWCATPEQRRRLVGALVLAQPSPDPTGTGTRLAVATWLRTSGYAADSEPLIG